MDISVQELTSVDKEITITANRQELTPKFDEALKKYQGQIQMPGFRPGKVPLSLVRKRFGQSIELEEINKYVQEVYEKEVVPEYEPVGETEMVDLQWENDELEVIFKIGAKPVFDLSDFSKIDVDKMVHDVTDQEVQEEIDRILERQGNWEQVDDKITEDYRVVVDVTSLDDDGNPIEGETEENQTLNLKDEGAKDFRESLIGKKTDDVVEMELGHDDHVDKFRLHIKKVEKPLKTELTDEFAKKQSNGEAKNVDEYKSFIKSRMQEYYDQTSEDLFQQDLMSSMTDAHEFEVPEVFQEQILKNYIEHLKQQSGNNLPPDFDADSYKENMRESAVEEGKWYFINLELQEKFDDIEITPEDIDAHIATEAARYGVGVDQMKSYFAQNMSQLEGLRTTIRTNKVFEKLKDAVNINEMSKDKFRDKREKKDKKK